MPIERIFLDWSRPLLHAARDLLAQRYRDEKRFNLSNAAVILPGGKALRRFSELLAEKSSADGQVLFPPLAATIGALPELLLGGGAPFLNDSEELLLRQAVLREFSSAELERLIPKAPDGDDFAGWLELAERLRAVARELSGECLTAAEVLERAGSLADFPDEERWEVLTAIEQRYVRRLAELGLADKHLLRRAAIDSGGELSGDREIILVGTADLNLVSKRLIDRTSARVIALIHAPETLAERFDEYGCIVPGAWISHRGTFDARAMTVVETARDGAARMAEILRGTAPRYAITDVVIGAGDLEEVPYIQEALEAAGIPVRAGQGTVLARAPMALLLEAAVAYATSEQYEDFAALIRHPDLAALVAVHDLASQEPLDIVSLLDRHQMRHIQSRVGERVVGLVESAPLRAAIGEVRRLVAPFVGPRRPLAEWRDVIAQFLTEVYESGESARTSAARRLLAEATAALAGAFAEFRDKEGIFSPPVDAREAVGFFLQRIATEEAVTELDREGIEVLGWLELQHDDAAVLLLSGISEGKVPASVNADLFLPDALRAALGLLDNDRRLARDLYAFEAMRAFRDETHLIAARQDWRGESVLPSRLLFGTDDEQLPERVALLFGEGSRRARSYVSLTAAPERFAAPRPLALAQPIDRMSVTDFSSYLRCPYRYYLSRVLRLEAVNDDLLEMDRRLFGTLSHDVLNRFARGEERDGADARRIAAFLEDALHVRMLQLFGSDPHPAVLVQAEQLRMRLRTFAQWQARWRGEGWKIEHSEFEFGTDEVSLPFDGGSMGIIGRIDRIDLHEVSGEHAIIDYKTGDSAADPQRAYSSTKGWLDLQLPLYEFALKELGHSGEFRLGYIRLPQDQEAAHAAWAVWEQGVLDDALATARIVAGKVSRGEFWPPSRDRFEDDEFRWIVGDLTAEPAECAEDDDE